MSHHRCCCGGNPDGACCIGGVCSQRSQAECEGLSGTWLGAYIPCNLNPCNWSRACCEALPLHCGFPINSSGSGFVARPMGASIEIDITVINIPEGDRVDWHVVANANMATTTVSACDSQTLSQDNCGTANFSGHFAGEPFSLPINGAAGRQYFGTGAKSGSMSFLAGPTSGLPFFLSEWNGSYDPSDSPQCKGTYSLQWEFGGYSYVRHDIIVPYECSTSCVFGVLFDIPVDTTTDGIRFVGNIRGLLSQNGTSLNPPGPPLLCGPLELAAVGGRQLRSGVRRGLLDDAVDRRYA